MSSEAADESNDSQVLVKQEPVEDNAEKNNAANSADEVNSESVEDERAPDEPPIAIPEPVRKGEPSEPQADQPSLTSDSGEDAKEEVNAENQDTAGEEQPSMDTGEDLTGVGEEGVIVISEFLPPHATQQLVDAQDKVRNDPFVCDAWELLATQADRWPDEYMKKFYHSMLSVFPTSAAYWRKFISSLIARGLVSDAGQAFARSLARVPDVGLYKMYMEYCKQVFSRSDFREERLRAAQFAVEHVGWDVHSKDVWKDFLEVQKERVMYAQSNAMQVVASARKAFRKASLAPVMRVEELLGMWEDFERQEANQYRSRAAKDQINVTLKHAHNAAKSEAHERKVFIEKLKMDKLSAKLTSENAQEYKTLWTDWKKFLDYEIEHSSVESRAARVETVYKQSLGPLYRFSGAWFAYAKFLASEGREDDCIALLQRAVLAVPHSLPLRLCLLEELEKAGASRLEQCKIAWEEGLQKCPSAIMYIQFQNFSRRSLGIDAFRAAFLRTRKAENCTHQVWSHAAITEWRHNNNPTLARKLFEMGMRYYSNEVDFVLAYADLLDSLKQDVDARLLFERTLDSNNTALPKEAARAVWDRYLRFEKSRLELASLAAVEARRAKCLAEPDTSSSLTSASQNNLQPMMMLFAERCALPGLECISEEEIQVLGAVAQVQTEGVALGRVRSQTRNVQLPDKINDLILRLPRIEEGMPVDNVLQKIMGCIVPSRAERARLSWPEHMRQEALLIRDKKRRRDDEDDDIRRPDAADPMEIRAKKRRR